MAKKKNNEQINPTVENEQDVETDEEIEKKKKKRRIKFKIFLYFLLFAFIGLFIAAYALNWFTLRQSILDVLIVGDEQYMMKMIDLDNEKEKAKGEQTLAADAKAAYENQLASLQARETAIAEKEKQIQTRLAAIVNNTENGDESRKNAIAMFERMDADSAAKALQSMNDVDAVANILTSMKQKSAAAIMEAFDTEYAALVAARMML